MQDEIIPVNKEALSRALVAVVGEVNAQAVVQAYQAIDKAMAYGFEKGKQAAEEANSYATGFSDGEMGGFKAGYQRAEADYRAQEALDHAQNLQDSYDDGYVDGVSDARMCPSGADAEVARLCADDVADCFDIYAGDSGAENPVQRTSSRTSPFQP